MRNKKALFLLPLLAISLVSCESNDKPTSTIFCDFENGYQDLNTAVLVNDFGKVSPNYIPEFVKEGNASALLQPTGVYKTSVKPLVYFPLASNLYNFNKSDIRNYDSVSFSIYNDSDKEVNGSIGFVADVIAINSVSKTKISDYTLKTRQWNDFTFVIDHAHCNLFFDIKETPGLYFEFDNQNVSDPSFAPRLYLDAIKFANAKTPHIISDDFILDENEICDFEKDFQKYFLSAQNVFEDALKFSIVDDVEGIKASHGNKFLCIDVKAKGAVWENWSSVFLTEQYMRKTALINLDLPEEAQSYRLVYDLCFVVPQGAVNQNRVVTRFYNRGMTKTAITVPCVDETKPLVDDNICCPTLNNWYSFGFTFCKEYEFASSTFCIDTNYTGVSTGRFEFSIGNLSVDYKILIDNIRLCKIA